jgi:hypothetical protein
MQISVLSVRVNQQIGVYGDHERPR